MPTFIDNTVKFSPPGAEITIEVSGCADEVATSVADQDPGIPPEERDCLLTYYSKVRTRPAGGERSTGPGPAAARRIVEGHGGKVRVRSRRSEGSVFFSPPPRG